MPFLICVILSAMLPREVYTELLTRNARSRMRHFAPFVMPRLILDPFHTLLCDTLDMVVDRRIMRLLLIAPPQHGKSTFTSKIFPARWLAKYPDDPVMITSVGDELASDMSYGVREIIESDEYHTLYPNIRSRRDNRAKNAWGLEGHQGGVRAAGVGGLIIGRPSGMGIIDDPIKSWEEASSQTYRDKTYNWYRTTFYSRLWETAPVILMLTRWHEDDLAGRILRSKEASQWTILRFPALAETQEERDDSNRRLGLPAGLPDPLRRLPGEALAPHRYSARYLENLRDTSTPQHWFSLYQGTPRPLEGGFIKRGWLTIVEDMPFEVESRIRYWDLAATKDGGARTAGVLMSRRGGNYYIEDVVFGQWDTEERNNVIKQTAELDAIRYVIRDPAQPNLPPSQLPGYNSVSIYIEQEPGSSGKDAIHHLITDVLGRYPVYGDPATGSKDVRMQPFASQAAARNVFVKSSAFTEAYIEEITSIPNGMFRDMADASSGAFNQLAAGGFGFGMSGGADEDGFA